MTTQQTQRLAEIRVEIEKWSAFMPDYVKRWDSYFLLDLLDEKNRHLKEVLAMTYKATAGGLAGVTIIFDEGTDIGWFLEMALSKGYGVDIERLPECGD